LTRYLLSEMEHIARRAQIIRHNAVVIRDTQAKVDEHIDRDVILDVLHEGRRD